MMRAVGSGRLFHIIPGHMLGSHAVFVTSVLLVHNNSGGKLCWFDLFNHTAFVFPNLLYKPRW